MEAFLTTLCISGGIQAAEENELQFKPQGSSRKAKKSRNTDSESSASIEAMQAMLAESESKQKALKKDLARALKRQRLSVDGLSKPDPVLEPREDTHTKDKDTSQQTKSPAQVEKPLNHAQKKQLARKQYKAARREEILQRRTEFRKAKRAAKAQGTGEDTQPGRTPHEASPAAAMPTTKGREDDDLGLATAQHTASATRPLSRSAGDMKAWSGLELDSQILDAIASLGFEQPTSIQQECLPAAIRDRRDVIGAAQTVRLRSCCHCTYKNLEVVPLHLPSVLSQDNTTSLY